MLQDEISKQKASIEKLETLSCDLKFKLANALVDLDDQEEGVTEVVIAPPQIESPRPRASLFQRARSLSFNMGKKMG
jgi:hypothetical protein